MKRVIKTKKRVLLSRSTRLRLSKVNLLSKFISEINRSADVTFRLFSGDHTLSDR